MEKKSRETVHLTFCDLKLEVTGLYERGPYVFGRGVESSFEIEKIYSPNSEEGSLDVIMLLGSLYCRPFPTTSPNYYKKAIDEVQDRCLAILDTMD